MEVEHFFFWRVGVSLAPPPPDEMVNNLTACFIAVSFAVKRQDLQMR